MVGLFCWEWGCGGCVFVLFFFQAEDGIRDVAVTGVQTCALPISGIPGTLGGALAMNAGAFGGETWRHVHTVETIDRGGHTHQRAAGEYRVSYRQVIAPAPEEWFIGASLSFERRPGAHEGEVRALLEQRRASQPIGEWSCGSVFTNPPGDHAAR